MLDGGSAESVSGTEDDLFALSDEAVSEFTNGRRLAHTIDTHDHNDVRATRRQLDVVSGGLAIFGKERGNLFAQDGVELFGGLVGIALDTSRDAFDDFERSIDAHIGGDEDLFELIEHVGIYLALGGDKTA